MIDAGRLAAAAIREARLQAGLTQEKAAALRGHATSTISRWENGGLPQTWDELHEYALAIGQTITLRLGPTTKEAAPPEWARAMEQRLLSEVRLNRSIIGAVLADVDPQFAQRVMGRLEAQLGPHAQRDGEAPVESRPAMPQPQSPRVRS